MTLVTGEAKTSVAEFAFCDALRILERNFSQHLSIVGAHLDKLNSFPPLKINKSDHVINYLGCISSLVGVFNPLPNEWDLKSAALLLPYRSYHPK